MPWPLWIRIPILIILLPVFVLACTVASLSYMVGLKW